MNQPATGDPIRSVFTDEIAESLAVAQRGDAEAFSRLAEKYRRELLVHCYRMMGSLEDAEDLVQETFLRAWRRLETYQGRASFRAWLYKIATNASLDALERLPRRMLPIAEEAGSLEKGESLPEGERAWLEPIPDAWLAPTSASPEAEYDSYENISLAFMVALHILPPRQRTVLIFADVLDWSMADIAEVLGVSLSAVTSQLSRARATMKQRNESGRLDPNRLRYTDVPTRKVLDQYARAWEAADLDGIIALLADDAIFPMPPMPAAIAGKQAMAAFYRSVLFGGNTLPGWKLVPIRANAQPGFAFYRLDESTQRFHPFVLQLLELDQGLVVNATTFGSPSLFRFFDLPEML